MDMVEGAFESWNITLLNHETFVKVEIQIVMYENVDNTDFGVLEKNHKI